MSFRRFLKKINDNDIFLHSRGVILEELIVLLNKMTSNWSNSQKTGSLLSSVHKVNINLTEHIINNSQILCNSIQLPLVKFLSSVWLTPIPSGAGASLQASSFSHDRRMHVGALLNIREKWSVFHLFCTNREHLLPEWQSLLGILVPKSNKRPSGVSTGQDWSTFFGGRSSSSFQVRRTFIFYHTLSHR